MFKRTSTAADRAAAVRAWGAHADNDPRDPFHLSKKLADEYAALERRRTFEVQKRAPMKDAIAGAHAVIDREYAAVVKDRAEGLVYALTGRVTARTDSDPTLELKTGEMPMVTREINWRDALLWLGPDAMKAQAEALIRGVYQAIPAEEIGAPLAQRLATFQVTTAEMQAVSDEHAAVVDAAAQLTPPIVLELLPHVRDQRSQAARAKEQRRLTRHAQLEHEAAQQFPHDRTQQVLYVRQGMESVR